MEASLRAVMSSLQIFKFSGNDSWQVRRTPDRHSIWWIEDFGCRAVFARMMRRQLHRVEVYSKNDRLASRYGNNESASNSWSRGLPPRYNRLVLLQALAQRMGKSFVRRKITTREHAVSCLVQLSVPAMALRPWVKSCLKMFHGTHSDLRR